MINLHAGLKNNVVMKENTHEKDGATAKTQLLIFYAKVKGCMMRICLVLATGPGNLPAVRVRTGRTVRFSSKTVQKPDSLRLALPDPVSYPSIDGFRLVWLDLQVQSPVLQLRLF